MKIHLYLITVLLLTFCGCIHEERGDCPSTGNVILMFNYKGDTNHDIFLSKINNVDVFVFDNTGRSVLSKRVNRNQLKKFQGTSLDLKKDRYIIICWANMDSKTKLNSSPTLISSFITLAESKINYTPTSIDPLYYAPQNQLNIVNDNLIQQSINFKSAHAIINVFTKDLFDPDSNGVNYLPRIELNRIFPQYDFLMQSSGTPLTFTKVAMYADASKTITGASFIVPRFANDAGMDIKIYKSSSNEIATTIDLQEFLEENNIDILNTQELEINILVEYQGASVNITIPSWEGLPITIH